MTATTSLADAKSHLSAIVASAELTHECAIITKNGKPAAIIIGIEFISGPLAEQPSRVGKPLEGALAGRFGARRGEYRIVYTIEDEIVTVTVVCVAHRRYAYRP